ncbi:hypothetical protein [Micromonospora okii]|uniref:hypothetical protein n=1 Tax=Micromonospora okii TaxID=1182970 RepID=UPI001E2DC8E4|nr:hypothetical protein [Micromonospora okii]
MRFPDAVTVLRQLAADEYGNPGTGGPFVPVAVLAGFRAGDAVYLAPGANIQRGDRLTIGPDTFDVEGDPRRLRSPSREVLTRVAVRPHRR